MKNSRIISLLLVLCLVLSLVYPLPAKAAEENGMVINKTATANNDGTYTIQLEAYATGSKIITETTKDKPTDIILVLDQSGSMARCIVCGEEMNGYNDTHNTYTAVDAAQIDNDESYYIKDGTSYRQVYYCNGDHGYNNCSGGSGWYTGTNRNQHTTANKKDPAEVQFYEATQESCSSRINALKDAAENFVDAVQEKAVGSDTTSTSDNVAHRIAVVGFASNASNLTGGFKDMTDSDDVGDVRNVINALGANGGTLVDAGISIANQIFAANPIATGSDRQRVLIVFTDGAPGMYGDWGQSSVNTANAAISNANTAKNDYEATVYTVGIFSGADASSPDSLPAYTAYDRNDNVSEENQIKNSNRFMHLVSSNYPNSTNIRTPGAINPDLNGNSYYLSAGDAETLNSIFQQISDQIESGSSSSSLTEEAIVKDIIAPEFTLPAGATAANITLETYSCTGKVDGEYTWTNNNDTMGAVATVNGDNVNVTGFNFSENYVAEIKQNGEVTGYMGDKLVITFTVKPKDGYLGGNAVETNASAGIYEDANATEPIATFPKPLVNVPIDTVVVANADDQNVYLYETLTGADLKGDAKVTVGNVELKLNEANYGIEEWQNADVNIDVEVTDKDGNPVTDTTFANLTADSEYNIKVTVSPKNTNPAEQGEPAVPKSGEDNAKINVYKPLVTFMDSSINANTLPEYATNNFVSVVWKHGEGEDAVEATQAMGEAPFLIYTYSPDGTEKLTKETEVKVSVAIDTTPNDTTDVPTDVTEHVSFYRQKCEVANSCGFNGGPVDAKDENRINFIVHMNTCDLVITKHVVNQENAADTFVFTVSGPEGFSKTVVINGSDSVTIADLPVGEYTVTEDTTWSWRYDCEQSSITKTIAPEDNEFEFTNTFDPGSKWLTDTSYAKNLFGSGSADIK